jgi:hypothetical protein
MILQKEYIVAELRKKIYPDLSGKAKSEEIMAGKKKKIFDIAMKNSIKTIFPDMKLGTTSMYDEELRTKLYREVYGESGYPKFIYRDSEQKAKLSEKDRKCYYMIGSEVRIGNEVGQIVDVDLLKEICFVDIDGDISEFNLDKVSRIL